MINDLKCNCHPGASRDMTIMRRLVLSALTKCKKRQPMWPVSESSAQSEIKWTVKSPSKALLKEVKCIMWKVPCVHLSWHLLLCQGPLLWSLSSSFEGAREGSLLLQSLSFISTPSHHPLGKGKGERHKQTGLAFYTSISSLTSLLLLIPFPLHFSRALLALFDLKTFLYFSWVFCVSPHFIHLN